MMTHEQCVVPSWFPSFLETRVESANLQFCHQARAPGAQIFCSFPLSDWVLDEENATFLLPFPSFWRACCRQENLGTRGKERMTLSILCFCGMPKMSVKSLWGTLSLISLFESAFAKWERMLTQNKYQCSMHVQYVSCASRFLFTITICDHMLFFALLMQWTRGYLLRLMIDESTTPLEFYFFQPLSVLNSMFRKAVDVMKTEWLMTNSLWPRLVHILSARPKRLESSRRTCLGSRETKVSNCTVHYALPVWILGGESIGRRYNEM
jgi:hypothetical protein